MAQEYYSLERAAEVLNISLGEVNRMREQGQLRAFRDGSNWKFRKEDVEESLANLIKKRNQQAQAEEEDVLTFGLSEEDEEQPTLMVGESNLSDTTDGLSLDADEDSSLGLGLDLDDTINHDSPIPSHTVDLAQAEQQLEEDDELVLGGGSDLNLTGASGLELVEDSGEAVLELDEDSDILALTNAGEDSEVPTVFAAEGEVGNQFNLIAEADADESESSSQVIALDDDSSFGAEISDFGSDAFDGVSDFGPEVSADAFGPAVSSGGFGQTASPTPKSSVSGRSPYEATYSGKAVTALGLLCFVPVGLAGLMVYDLVRNMWSWDQPAVLSSPIIDMLAGVLGWK